RRPGSGRRAAAPRAARGPGARRPTGRARKRGASGADRMGWVTCADAEEVRVRETLALGAGRVNRRRLVPRRAGTRDALTSDNTTPYRVVERRGIAGV